MQWQPPHNAEGKDAVFLHCDFSGAAPALGTPCNWVHVGGIFQLEGNRGDIIGWRVSAFAGAANPLVAGVCASPNLTSVNAGIEGRPGRTILIQCFGVNGNLVSDNSGAIGNFLVTGTTVGRSRYTTTTTELPGAFGRALETSLAAGQQVKGFIRCM